MAKVVVAAPVDALPELLRAAVRTVAGATLIEVRPDGALVGRRSNFALGSETTRFTFSARPDGSSEVTAEATNGGSIASTALLGSNFTRGALLENGRAVLNALAQNARDPSH
ncbi:hypothetical protein [Curtobacterium sp. MCBD17_040]|uniref:hypothetical protein n=1 Tax=Curtobacterium sp. MCBD17_040 TaxID=2175674 RepID=UPI000DA7E5E6|nr:hypothetical protein [Curtobacterium sp. MCBD17_040]WIB65761.1 hypothetical protein DEI94_16725 [Curtobacterium sp. MCBD17_040]